MDETNSRYVGTITFQAKEYIKECQDTQDKAVDLKLKNVSLEMKSLRDEYKKSEGLIADAKNAVDAHFKETNKYREELRLQAATFVKSDDIKTIIKAEISGLQTQVKVMWALLAALVLLFVAEWLRRGI